MSKKGPIVIVEDDLDDQELVQDAIREIGVKNKIVFFTNCLDAFDYLKTTNEQPFVILSDVNMPIQNGMEFKKQIDADPQLRQKSIPFIFLSTSVDKRAVDKAYTEMTVQGFFQKSNTYDELKEMLLVIMNYWKLCNHPNTD